MTTNHTCSYCNGKGYVEIRDCTGEIQREETCMLCGGTGKQSKCELKKKIKFSKKLGQG